MPIFKFVTGGSLGCLAILAIVAVVLFCSALFWGWPIMLVCGALGWHIGYWPASVLLGLGFSFIAG